MPTIHFRLYYTSILNFFQFLCSPKKVSSSDLSVGDKVLTTLFLFILKFCFSILIASIIGLFYEPQNLTDKSMSERFSPILYLIIGGMVLPVFEEVLFRLSLVFKPIYLSLTSACGMYYFLTKIIFASRLTMFDQTIYQRIGFSILFGVIVFLFLRNKNLIKKLHIFWSKKFYLIYYASAFVFAWLHILNFELTTTTLLLTPILTLPQLFSGLIAGYLRVKLGFCYPLLFHVLTNSILIGLDVLLSH